MRRSLTLVIVLATLAALFAAGGRLLFADGFRYYPPASGGGGGGAAPASPNDFTAANSFLDGANFKLKNTATPSKVLQFNLAGFTAATTRTATPPNADFSIASLDLAETLTGTKTFTGGMAINQNAALGSNIPLYLGTPGEAAIRWGTAQTPDTVYLGVGANGRSVVIAEEQDNTFDFAHANPTNPTLFVHSAAQSTSQWASLSHNGSNGVIGTGLGGVVFPNGTLAAPGVAWVTGGPSGMYAQSGYGTCFSGFGADGGCMTIGPSAIYHGLSLGSAGSVRWTAAASTAAADTSMTRVSAGVLKCAAGDIITTRCLLGGGPAVASAAALPLPTGGLFHVTGTTAITSITATNLQAGVCFTAIFDGVTVLTDGNNIVLLGSTNYTTKAGDTWSACFDGTNFYETGRSVN